MIRFSNHSAGGFILEKTNSLTIIKVKDIWTFRHIFINILCLNVIDIRVGVHISKLGLITIFFLNIIIPEFVYMKFAETQYSRSYYDWFIESNTGLAHMCTDKCISKGASIFKGWFTDFFEKCLFIFLTCVCHELNILILTYIFHGLAID